MKQFYKVTLRTRDIFNFTSAVVIKQYDPDPVIFATYNSKEGQLVDLRVSCTRNEKLVIQVALKDYILRIVPTDIDGKELSIMERIATIWK